MYNANDNSSVMFAQLLLADFNLSFVYSPYISAFFHIISYMSV